MDNILARTAQFQPAARARRFFCFFLKAARLRAVFLRFFSRMAVSYRLGELGQCSVRPSIIDRPCQDAQPPDQYGACVPVRRIVRGL